MKSLKKTKLLILKKKYKFVGKGKQPIFASWNFKNLNLQKNLNFFLFGPKIYTLHCLTIKSEILPNSFNFFFSKKNYVFSVFKILNFLYSTFFEKIEYCSINKFFWFNLNFILNSKIFIWYFDNLLKNLLNFLVVHINSFNFFYKSAFSLPILNWIKYNFRVFKNCFANIQNLNYYILVNDLDANFMFSDRTIINLLSKNSKICNLLFLDNNYISFWAFLNSNLFLSRSITTSTNISSAGLDFRVLKNFNKIYFWVNDFRSNFFYKNFFIWGWWNFFLRRGSWYYDFTLKTKKNNFLLNSTFIDISEDNLYSYNFDTFDFEPNFAKICIKKKNYLIYFLNSFNNNILI